MPLEKCGQIVLATDDILQPSPDAGRRLFCQSPNSLHLPPQHQRRPGGMLWRHAQAQERPSRHKRLHRGGCASSRLQVAY